MLIMARADIELTLIRHTRTAEGDDSRCMHYFTENGGNKNNDFYNKKHYLLKGTNFFNNFFYTICVSVC